MPDSIRILDGHGSGAEARILDNGALVTSATVRPVAAVVTANQDTYTTCSDIVDLPANTGESAVLWLKNNVDRDLYIEAIYISTSAPVVSKLWRNVTSGPGVQEAQPGKSGNTNFGANRTFPGSALVGGANKAFTDGTLISAQVLTEGRHTIVISGIFLLTRGNSLGITVDSIDNPALKVSATVICYYLDRDGVG